MSRLSFARRVAQRALKPFGLTAVPAAGIRTKDLMKAVNDILDRAADDPGHSTRNWNVNWGDLRCVDIIYCANCYGCWWIDVLIKEADCHQLAWYVSDKLSEQGWDTKKILRIRTEW